MLEPLSIGRMTLRNRMVMPAMATALAETSGLVSEEGIAYYARRAAGGVALVTLEVTGIHRLTRHREHVYMIDRDECIEGIGRLARSVQAHGAKFSVQLWHSGFVADEAILGEPPVAPSAIPVPGRKVLPRALTEGEIDQLVGAFAEGARRAREAGADAVEVHCAHGYLLAQFLSPLSNKRTDRYGGDLRNRARFALEVVTRIRELVGRDFPVLAKLSAEDHAEGGNTIEDTKLVARWLQEQGVDALLVSSGGPFTRDLIAPPMLMPRGCYVPFAAAVKSTVDVPVGAIGRINNPELAGRVLDDGQADFVALGRALLADPDFPRKVQEGRSDEIRRCTACRFCSETTSRRGGPIRCMVNPETGRELEWTLEKAVAPKRVLVVGAGPGGLEAARTAALRGHHVTISDQADYLGGMAALGCRPPSKAELKNVVEFYEGEMRRRGVKVRLGEPATAEWVSKEAPDAVVVATGSVPVVPAIPGIDVQNVVHARDVLAEKVSIGRSAVVVGGGDVGCETAEYLRARGLEVTVLEMLGEFAVDLEPGTRRMFLARLQSMDVKMISNARVVHIEASRVTYVDGKGRENAVEGEMIVLALGARPNAALIEHLKPLGVPMVAVGDCLEPRRIPEAIYEGALAGRQV